MFQKIIKKVFSIFPKQASDVKTNAQLDNASPKVNEKILELDRMRSSLELELEEKKKTIENLKQDYARLTKSMEQEMTSRIEENFCKLFTDISVPLGQLFAMKAFTESGKDLPVQEFFKPLDMIVGKFKGYFLKIIGSMNEKVEYDPKYHNPMGSGEIAPGQAVAIKVIGFTYKDKVIKKAMVSNKEE